MKTTILKTLFFLLSLGILFSCSKDDSPGNTPIGDETQLVLAASATETTPGEEITFEVIADGKAVSDAEILIDGTGISGYSHVFDSAGEYQVVAKKEGYKDSEALHLIVHEVQVDIYVAGYEKEGSTRVAKYWKNGVPVSLTNGTDHAEANSIFIYQGDVYAAGYEQSGSSVIAKYWKNGVPVNLTNGTNSSYATSIFVSEGDIYVAGYKYNGSHYVAKYWKNGAVVNLTDESNRSEAYSIFVSDGNVFVAGEEYDPAQGNYIAKYWKNDDPINLTDGTEYASAKCIFVFDGDVYVAGVGSDGIGYWKNGEPVILGNGALASSIFVSDQAIYVSGFTGGLDTRAKYWENGELTNLTENLSEANSIFASLGDAYVAGFEYNGEVSVAKYWKDGEAVNLTDGTNDAKALSIFVVETIVE